MKISKMMAGVAAAALMMTPISAHAAEAGASVLSLQQPDAPGQMNRGRGRGNGLTDRGLFVGVSFVLIVILVFIFATGNDDDGEDSGPISA